MRVRDPASKFRSPYVQKIRRIMCRLLEEVAYGKSASARTKVGRSHVTAGD